MATSIMKAPARTSRSGLEGMRVGPERGHGRRWGTARHRLKKDGEDDQRRHQARRGAERQ